MPKKTFTPEQIVPKLRQIEVLIGQGKAVPWRARRQGSPRRPSIGGVKSTAACNWSKPED